MRMSAYIVDRRFSEKNKSAVNRRRFIERFKQHIKKAVNDAVLKRNLSEIEKGEKIIIPAKEIMEPHFRFGKGGLRETVFPHNENFVKNDKIKRPIASSEQSGSKEGEPTDSSETGLDDFVFEISREEFLNIFFDDLALPDLVKKQLSQIEMAKPIRAGFKKTGSPSLISIKKTMQNAQARRIAFSLKDKKKLQDIKKKIADNTSNILSDELKSLILQKEALEKKIKKIPYIDTQDLRFHNIVLEPKPNTQAVMFCLMDVSGSMDESRKEIAKKFFILLYLFLTKSYKKIEIVFIRHHTSAKEVDENDFFYSRETGGTIVSSALELMEKIMLDRYSPNDWNIYAAQASDGDNWHTDSPHCAELLTQNLLPYLQFFAYIEIMAQGHQNLWQNYESVSSVFRNFVMRSVESAKDIYPVFRDFFVKRSGTTA